MKELNHSSRRKFIQQTAIAGAGLLLTNPLQIFSQTNGSPTMKVNIKSRGYAGKDEHGKLVPRNFDRRAVGDNDILMEIKYSGICHSDIHTIRGHWGKQSYPQIELIKADQINDTWEKVVNRQARYRYVIDAATF